MKIQKIQITDFKILKNIEKEINGQNILLVGDNEVGKSSFIQFIEIALGRDVKIPAEGNIWIDKNGNKYRFEVKPDKQGKNKVIIHSPDGMKDDRKSSLSEIVGAIEFDINNFVELSKTEKGRKEQVELFKSMLPVMVQEELNRIERNIKLNYDDRTETNKEIKKLEGAIKLSSVYNEINHLDRLQPVNVDDLTKRINLATNHNQMIVKSQSALENLINEQNKDITELDELELKIKTIKDAIASRNDRINKAQDWLDKNNPIDMSLFELEMKNASETNRKADEALRLKNQLTTLNEHKEHSDKLTAQIESERQMLQDTIKSIETSVDGLNYYDDGLYYAPTGKSDAVLVHPDNLSESVIIELGVKLKMAQNKNLGILCIERTESIGSKRWESILELAHKNNWQIIGEKVVRGEEQLLIELFS